MTAMMITGIMNPAYSPMRPTSHPGVTVPLILLAIPSVVIGWMTVEPVLYGGWLADAIHVRGQRCARPHGGRVRQRHPRGAHERDPADLVPGLGRCRCRLVLYGIAQTCRPDRRQGQAALSAAGEQFYFDELYVFVFAGGTRALGKFFWQVGDVTLIDTFAINGTPTASPVRRRAAPRPVGLPLSLRLRHDHRTLSVARLAHNKMNENQ